VAVGESTYPVLGSIIWQRNYHAMLASPMRVVDVLTGHLTFLAVRLLIATTAFALVGGALGAFRSTWIIAAVPIAVLCGLAHAAPVMAYAVRQENDQGFSIIFRLIMVPTFLFAGTFFPVDRLPAVLQPVAWVTPLWHGTESIRSLLLGRAALWPVLGHLAYLLLWAGAGAVVALHHYRRRLAT
jgi:lipooligosaccharide transport system permease protein